MKAQQITEQNSRMATAYHEAGNAVAAWRLGVPLERRGLNIIRTHGRNGPHLIARLLAGTSSWMGPIERIKVEKLAQICLAGRVAQHRYDPRSVRRSRTNGPGGDEQATLDTLLHLAGSDREIEAWYKLLNIRVEQMISDPLVWRAVERLAEALIQREKLSGREATEIIRAGFDEALKAVGERNSEGKSRTKLSL
jgi:hypothetical protein